MHPLRLPFFRKCWLACAVLVGGLIPSPVAATVLTYDLEGRISAPVILNWRWNNWTDEDTGERFNLQIDRGDLVLTYDDRGTASFSDDRLAIKGITHGCVGRTPCTGGPFSKDIRSPGWGAVYTGQGEFSWDLHLENPLVEKKADDFGIPKIVTTGLDDVVFGAQNVGTITLLNPGPEVPARIDVMAKNHEVDRYAFRLFDVGPKDDGIFAIHSWLFLAGGVLGGKPCHIWQPGVNKLGKPCPAAVGTRKRTQTQDAVDLPREQHARRLPVPLQFLIVETMAERQTEPRHFMPRRAIPVGLSGAWRVRT